MNQKILAIFLVFILVMSLSSAALAVKEHEVINDDTMSAIGEFKDEIGVIGNFLIAFSAVTSVLVFIIHFVKLSISPSHPIMRHKIMMELLVSAVCTSLIGAIGLIFKLYIGVFL